MWFLPGDLRFCTRKIQIYFLHVTSTMIQIKIESERCAWLDPKDAAKRQSWLYTLFVRSSLEPDGARVASRQDALLDELQEQEPRLLNQWEACLRLWMESFRKRSGSWILWPRKPRQTVCSDCQRTWLHPTIRGGGGGGGGGGMDENNWFGFANRISMLRSSWGVQVTLSLSISVK